MQPPPASQKITSVCLLSGSRDFPLKGEERDFNRTFTARLDQEHAPQAVQAVQALQAAGYEARDPWMPTRSVNHLSRQS
jgi:hypothetical protein